MRRSRPTKRQLGVAVEKIRAAADGLDGKRIAILGLAFKPNTSDVRESPALYICRALVEVSVSVSAYDPIAQPEAAHALQGVNVGYAKDAYDASQQPDAVVIVTEWNEFRNLDLERLRGHCPAGLDRRFAERARPGARTRAGLLLLLHRSRDQ